MYIVYIYLVYKKQCMSNLIKLVNYSFLNLETGIYNVCVSYIHVIFCYLRQSLWLCLQSNSFLVSWTSLELKGLYEWNASHLFVQSSIVLTTDLNNHRYLAAVDWTAVEAVHYRYRPTRHPPSAAQWDVWPWARAIAACLARLRGRGGVRDPLPRQLSGRWPCPRRHSRRPPQPWRPGDCAPPPSAAGWLLGHPHGRRPQPQELQTSYHAHFQVRISNEFRN